MLTLALDVFGVEGYFEAYVKYVKDRLQAQAEGQDLELVEFNLPAAIKRGLDDEETVPLDGEASSLDHEGNRAGVADGSDHDEDHDV